jgi:hypothetical protein
MQSLYEKFTEVKTSQDVAAVPWQDAVVWVTGEGEHQRFEWLHNEDIAYVVWTNGNVSIRPHSDSPLARVFEGIIISGRMVFVGKNIHVS